MTTRLRFRRPGGATLVIDACALAAMLRYRQSGRRDPEAGGVLLGRHILDAPHIVVDEVTVPTKGDRRLWAFFRRGRDAHQRVIDERWAASRGTCQYLGEWHTHPEPVPRASAVDLADWRRRLRADVFDGDSLIFLIVGTEALRVWEGSRAARTLTPLIQIADPLP
jgi:integrative and conjugative element protein (TIGR02256 family)